MFVEREKVTIVNNLMISSNKEHVQFLIRNGHVCELFDIPLFFQNIGDQVEYWCKRRELQRKLLLSS